MSNQIVQLFYVDSNSGVSTRWRNPDGSWSGEQSLGGVADEDVAAVLVPGTEILQLFYRTPTLGGGVSSRWRNPDGSWSGEQILGGAVGIGDITAIQVPGTEILQLFWQGTDMAVHSRWRMPDGSWLPEQSDQNIGGSVGASNIVAIVVPGTDILQLFYAGYDNFLKSLWRNPNGTWSSEQNLGVEVGGGGIAAAVVPGTEIVQVFYIGASTGGVRSIWRNPNGTWSTEQNLDGTIDYYFSSITACVVPGTEILQLFYWNNGEVRSRWRTPDGAWLPAQSDQNIGGDIADTSDITAIAVPGTDILQLFYKGSGGGVHSRWRNPDGTWSTEQTIGGDPTSGTITAALVQV